MRHSSWSRRARVTSGALLVSFFTSLMPASVLAQDASAENVAAARSLGIQGVKLAEEGKCKEAIEKLERAESLYHAPTILGRLGECQVQVGLIVKGTENLNKVVREQLPANAPKAFVDAQERARKALEAAQPRIAYLTVNVEPAGTQADVTVGGAAIPRALVGAERPTDPGTHEVNATAQGFLPAKANVTLGEGKHETVTLKLSPDPNATATPAGTPGAQPAPGAQPPPGGQLPPPTGTNPPPQESKGKSKALPITLIVVGGIGLLVGTFSGLSAMSQTDTLEKECSDGDPTNCEDKDIDEAKKAATASTVGFGIGIVATTIGVILLATSGKKESAASDHKPKLHPYVGLKNAGITGSF